MNSNLIKEFLNRTGHGVVQYLKAIVLSSLINFIVLIFGLKYANIPYYGLIAFAIAIVDLLPVLGSGLVLIPWAIIVLVQGNGKLSAILIVLYIITFILSQILEPLILGKSIGLKPIYTLGITVISMVVLTPGVGAVVGALISIVVAVIIDMRRGEVFGGKGKGSKS
ncbi:AI-2E family transporter [Lagierella sp.]|uniref:AI-2E family transporter n=1 Tax=Lagierella sp. TaxID=2849657 RepID=UPI00262AE892|nr:AI-2E family transporter [Lagierella sp.]